MRVILTSYYNSDDSCHRIFELQKISSKQSSTRVGHLNQFGPAIFWVMTRDLNGRWINIYIYIEQETSQNFWINSTIQIFLNNTTIPPIIPSLRQVSYFFLILIFFLSMPFSRHKGENPHVRTCYCVIAMLVNWDPKFWYTTGNLISDIASLMTFLGIHGIRWGW